jgi:cytoskeletal protein CcmA (bactofilin family)
MFRKKEDDIQEELSIMVSDNNKDQQGRSEPTIYNSGDNNASRTAPVGRAPAPAAGAPASGGYRPASVGQTSAVPAARPSATPATNGQPSVNRTGTENNAARPAGDDMRQSPAVSAKTNKRVLTVGNDILLKGEIATCDRLVIEGMVDATLKDVHTVEISETGSFKGTAEIQDAEISGLFEGNLIVRNRLTIYSTGRVRGTISYGEIEIERGGQMTGEIRLGTDADKAAGSKKVAA